jgi:prolipoprotein diacylglyceryltransferase
VLPEVAFVHAGAQVVLSLHAAAIVVGVMLGAVMAIGRAREPALMAVAVPLVALAGLAGSHGLFAAIRGGNGFWTGGLASTGGIVAGLAATWAIARACARPLHELLDPLAPAAIAALGVGRLGCFLGGCCFGAPTMLPWGVVFPELGPPARHPLQLYSAAGDFALAGLLLVSAPPGAVTRRACVGLGLLRTALECLRDPGATDVLPGGWLTLPQAAALLLVAGGFTLARAGGIEYGSRAEDSRRWPMRSR